MPEVVETIVTGGGQAGLAMSHHLQQRGREHVIRERGRIAERWRSERWDSLHPSCARHRAACFDAAAGASPFAQRANLAASIITAWVP